MSRALLDAPRTSNATNIRRAHARLDALDTAGRRMRAYTTDTSHVAHWHAPSATTTRHINAFHDYY